MGGSDLLKVCAFVVLIYGVTDNANAEIESGSL